MSLITLTNSCLTVQVDTIGATLSSIEKDGVQYLWQGSARSWTRKDANLFPWVGRLQNGVYRYGGREYSMTPHGFCREAEFAVTARAPDHVDLTLGDNDATREVYPFRFRYHVRYTLEGNRVVKTCVVENPDEKPLYFGLGSHPGFNVPLGGEGAFEDWWFEYPECCTPRQVCLDTSNWLIAPGRPLYPLKEGRKLPLHHDLFDKDAIILENAPRVLTLRSDKSSRSVTVSYPGMPWVGLWHTPGTEAPFVCVEPWLSLPSDSGQVSELETKADLMKLAPGGVYENRIEITIK